ncbi:Vacuolar iron transporter like 4 [Glycine soja]|uniref:Vacuolar iron transporter n=1 Tax=Glycine soja TaxID=3848 RepID=A0A0B2NPW9_GLYSO|nr:Vacuolar iron transporter like 4 [Glycine soja]
MANLGARTNGISSTNQVEIPMHVYGVEPIQSEESDIYYSQRAQWLRAAVLGANDGLVSVSSLMMGVGAVKKDISGKILAGFAYDIEKTQLKREREANNNRGVNEEARRGKLPNPFQAALASAFAFSVGALVPMLATVFIRSHKVRMGVVAAAVSLALLVFGGAGAVLGKTPVTRSCIRVLVGGWMAMAITFGLTKLIGSADL